MTSRFDQLVVATGGQPSAPPSRERRCGRDLRGADARRWIRDRARTSKTTKPKKAVIVGGGYIGLEMAEALVKLAGLTSSCVDKLPQPMSTLDPDMGELVADAMRGRGHRALPRRGRDGLRTVEMAASPPS